MMNKVPRVSVLMASYNQGQYIREAIESVLAQSFVDYEFLIADDSSPDDSREIIGGYDDPRIKHYFIEENRGSVLTTEFLCKNANGEYLAFIGSDDVWKPEKLKRQIAAMDDNPNLGVCFTWANTINEEGKVLSKSEISYAEIFLQKNRSQGKWLNHFFYKGNCLCHPSAMLRKTAYEQVGSHSIALRQVPDFDLWVRLTKKYDIHVVDEVLASNRMLLRNKTNMSAVTNATIIRNMNEFMMTVGDFFTDMSDEVFIEGFSEEFRKQGPWTSSELECEKAFILMKGNYLKLASQIEAFHRLKILLDDETTRETLKNSYGFTDKSFFDISGSEGLGAYISANTQELREDVTQNTNKCVRWGKKLLERLNK